MALKGALLTLPVPPGEPNAGASTPTGRRRGWRASSATSARIRSTATPATRCAARLIAEMRAVGLEPARHRRFRLQRRPPQPGGDLRAGAQPRRDDRPGRGPASAARLALRQHLRRPGRGRRRDRRRDDAGDRRACCAGSRWRGRSPSCSTKARRWACSAPAPSSSATRSRRGSTPSSTSRRAASPGRRSCSRPAGRTAPPIALYRAAAARPVANSLSTDLYGLIPNSTDVAVFDERPWTILNFAVIGNETRYHSAGDDLAALDRRSLQHMGDQALAVDRRWRRRAIRRRRRANGSMPTAGAAC